MLLLELFNNHNYSYSTCMSLKIFSFIKNLKKGNILTPKRLRLKEKIQININKNNATVKVDVIILHNFKQE
jgi:hypothetical protein